MTTLSKKQRKMRNRILIAAALLVLVKLLPLTGWVRGLCCLAPYFIIGYDVLRKAALGIVNGQVFDENFLMALATVGAYATGEFDEAVFVMLFYQVGELFQAYAVGKSRKSISAMMDIAPDYANVEQPDGTLEQVFPDDIAVGTVIVVKPGERVPIDGVIVEGIDNCPIKFAKCCSPLPGDPIVGFITRGFGVSIHKQSCVNAISSMKDPTNAPRWVKAYWADSVKDSYKAGLEIVALDRNELLRDVLSALADIRVPIYTMNARQVENNCAVVSLTIGINNTEHLNRVVARLSKVKDVLKVTRS